MSTSKVAVVRTTPATVLEDYHRVMNLAGYQDVVAKDADTALKVNISWHFFYPGCSTTPWQLEGVIRGMLRDGYSRDLIHACHNRTVVIDARLGEDPLRPDADPDRAWTRISRSRAPLATLLMDQKVIAGVGNVYRAEVLFRHGLDPLLPGRGLRRGQWDAVWADLVELLRDGVRRGRIETLRAEHAPAKREQAERSARQAAAISAAAAAGNRRLTSSASIWAPSDSSHIALAASCRRCVLGPPNNNASNWAAT